MKYYLAGQMTGIPQFNFPRFVEVANRLRMIGMEILNPAEIDNDYDREQALASETGEEGSVTSTWGQCLGRDIKIVADDVDGVILMDNWHLSKGARLEAYCGIISGKQFHTYTDHGLFPRDKSWVMNQIVLRTVETFQ